VRLTVLAVASWLFLLAIAVQVFLAGAGLFGLMDFTLHGMFGWSLSLGPVVLLILAIVARVDRATLLLSLALLLDTVIQPELAAARYESPVIAAFHPVNALLIFWLTWTLTRRATNLARADSGKLAAASATD
jgi:hypothetical protein